MRPAHSAREIEEIAAELEFTPEASMRPAHSAREICLRNRQRAKSRHASMRPAHSAREILPPTLQRRWINAGFNEARAFSAGNQVE